MSLENDFFSATLKMKERFLINFTRVNQFLRWFSKFEVNYELPFIYMK